MLIFNDSYMADKFAWAIAESQLRSLANGWYGALHFQGLFEARLLQAICQLGTT